MSHPTPPPVVGDLSEPHPVGPGEPAEPLPRLVDERSAPGFRDLFGRCCAESTDLDVAIARIRLGGLELRMGELSRLSSIRVVLAEVNAVRLAAEADAALADAAKRENVEVLRLLFRAGRLHLRAAPLAGWSPDFSVFGIAGTASCAIVGPHWFQKPYPHPGPALASIHGPQDARRLAVRFSELWMAAHDIGPAIQAILEGAARRGAPTGVSVDTNRLQE